MSRPGKSSLLRKANPVASVSSAVTRGKRSGVVIDKNNDELQDMDAMFEVAGSPATSDRWRRVEKDAKKKVQWKEKNKPKTVRNLARTRNGRSRTVNLSLPGVDDDSGEGNVKASRYLSKVISSKGRHVAWSPSDLSNVSSVVSTPVVRGDDSSTDEQDVEDSQKLEKENRDDRKSLTPQEHRNSPAEKETDFHESQSPAEFQTPRDDHIEITDVHVDTSHPQISPLDPAETLIPQRESEDVLTSKKTSSTMKVHNREEDENLSFMSSESSNVSGLGNGDFDGNGEGDADDLIPPLPPDEESLNGEVTEASAAQNTGSSPLSKTAKLPQSLPDQDDSGDDDGPGFAMATNYDVDDDVVDSEGSEAPNLVHDPQTPTTNASASTRMSKKRKSSSVKRREQSPKESDLDETPPKLRKTRQHRKKPIIAVSPHEGFAAANRDYESVPVTDFVQDDHDDSNVRRSRRARCKPLAFWKNERLIYGPADEDDELGEALDGMPIVKNVVKALPTPYKLRAVSSTQRMAVRESSDPVKPFDSRKLRKKFKVNIGETASIWDDMADNAADLKVVAYARKMDSFELPVPDSRSKREGKVVGRAAQAFNIPGDDENGTYVGYIMGTLVLPPKGIKDAESVGPCSQTFTVCNCQPKALELAFGSPDEPEGMLNPETAQRFLLSPGDLFRVPPGNCYRLENHSREMDCLLTWTIIRPRISGAQSDD